MGTPLIDLSGQHFGKIVVLRREPRKAGERGPAKWRCQCDCGEEAVYYGIHIRAGKACMCTNPGGHPTHGQTLGGKPSGTYRAWDHMLQRATNPNNPRWMDYGGRGIGVCERWLSFANFYADMGDRPPEMTLERKDNDLGYSPGNCRWATNHEQQQNKRPRGMGWKARQSRRKTADLNMT